MSAEMTIAVSTGMGRYWMNPVPSSMHDMTAAAMSETACVRPPYCSFIDERETLPFTGQQPTRHAAKLLSEKVRISRLSRSV